MRDLVPGLFWPKLLKFGEESGGCLIVDLRLPVNLNWFTKSDFEWLAPKQTLETERTLVDCRQQCTFANFAITKAPDFNSLECRVPEGKMIKLS